MSPKMIAAAIPIRMIPAMAAVPYTGFTPRNGIDTTKPNHNTKLRTTAEARPAVASAKPASGPGTFETVSNR